MEGVPGHAEITNLTSANRDTDEALLLMNLLAQKLCIRVEGPFFAQGLAEPSDLPTVTEDA